MRRPMLVRLQLTWSRALGREWMASIDGALGWGDTARAAVAEAMTLVRRRSEGAPNA